MKTPRWETFSDGVFAIAITLLIIEIKVPHDGPLLPALGGLWPSFAAYVASFVYIGTWWMGHHRLGDQVERVDGGFLLLNVLFLMTIAFIPFPTALLADRVTSREDAGVAAAFYAAAALAPSLAVNVLTEYAVRRGLYGSHLGALRPFLRFRWVGVLVYAAAIPIALVFPVGALVFFVISPLVYAVVLARQHFESGGSASAGA